MSNLRIIAIIILLLSLCVAFYFFVLREKNGSVVQKKSEQIKKQNSTPLDPLSIQVMREKQYPGSNLTIEETLAPGSNYDRYIASYKSDGLKIYGLLTVPQGSKPKPGWPVIIFNHGYIPPKQYRTTERYIAYVDAFARNGYIVFKPDFRGHGDSEGQAEGAYYSPAYTTDALNALASVKKYKDADPQKIGMWGHSMGGHITLRSLVVRPKDIKAAVIWGGVVGSYSEIINWHDPTYRPPPDELRLRNRRKAELIKKYGTPQANPVFWNSIDPTNFLSDISAKIQLHHGESDEEVPVSFALSLKNKLKKAGKPVELFLYPGSDHNISQGFDEAMQRSVEFFDKNLK